MLAGCCSELKNNLMECGNSKINADFKSTPPLLALLLSLSYFPLSLELTRLEIREVGCIESF
jgi:hypothetical protein